MILSPVHNLRRRAVPEPKPRPVPYDPILAADIARAIAYSRLEDSLLPVVPDDDEVDPATVPATKRRP